MDLMWSLFTGFLLDKILTLIESNLGVILRYSKPIIADKVVFQLDPRKY